MKSKKIMEPNNNNFSYLMTAGFFAVFLVSVVFYLGVKPEDVAAEPSLSAIIFGSPEPDYPVVTFLPVDIFPNEVNFSRKPEVKAESALIYDLTNDKPLFEKEPQKRLLIASLTKLMTALVASENIKDAKQRLFVLDEDLKIENPYNDLKSGDNFNLEEALHFILIRSDNAVANVLGRSVFKEGSKFFVFEMNRKAQQLKMENTLFYDPIGLASNISTVYDMKNLAKEILESYQGIFLISKIPEIKVISPAGLAFNLKNTNTLVSKIQGILGSKTGFTPEASGSLLVIFKDGQKMILSLVLGSQDRFKDSQTLIDWYWRYRN